MTSSLVCANNLSIKTFLASMSLAHTLRPSIIPAYNVFDLSKSPASICLRL